MKAVDRRTVDDDFPDRKHVAEKYRADDHHRKQTNEKPAHSVIDVRHPAQPTATDDRQRRSSRPSHPKTDNRPRRE
ncbi:hypothetical protein [Amycolatopsis sp. MEPSY49]|uniref:hypothetical protein n=1 Tax=Amycolatopsis sp. MEPSY49 TaxID=3151600 RepID=UPI003EF69E91